MDPLEHRRVFLQKQKAFYGALISQTLDDVLDKNLQDIPNTNRTKEDGVPKQSQAYVAPLDAVESEKPEKLAEKLTSCNCSRCTTRLLKTMAPPGSNKNVHFYNQNVTKEGPTMPDYVQIPSFDHKDTLMTCMNWLEFKEEMFKPVLVMADGTMNPFCKVLPLIELINAHNHNLQTSPTATLNDFVRNEKATARNLLSKMMEFAKTPKEDLQHPHKLNMLFEMQEAICVKLAELYVKHTVYRNSVPDPFPLPEINKKQKINKE